MRIFALDSSSEKLVMCYADDQDIFTLTYKGTERHASKLAPVVKSFLDCVNKSIENIDYFGCGVGPGSLTGLRIGIAFIQGMACSLSKFVIPVVSLELIASNFCYHRGEIVIVKRAREGYVYLACYKQDKQILSPTVMEVQTAKDFLRNLRDPIIAGDAKHDFEDFGIVCSDELEDIKGEILAAKVLTRAKDKMIIQPHELEPLYLQKSIAEMNFEKRQS
ncbi:MAG TPA: tRNA (adenosine(37)-N6)-threonylcarbamoyltransferase complex dimerization subunit type 1 TsaB [Pseudothermotoga sp.]